MESFPEYVQILLADYGEEFDPAVERTEMERGVPRQRILNTHVLQLVNASILFRSKQAAADFEAWYFNNLKRIGWFDLKHPRTGETVRARFQAGKIGGLQPLTPRFGFAKRDLVLEYMR